MEACIASAKARLRGALQERRRRSREQKAAKEDGRRGRRRNLDDMEQYLHYVGGGAGALALTGVAAASAFYLASRPASEKPLFPLDAQCLVEEEGPDLVRVSRFYKDAKEGKFVSYLYPDARTLYECFRKGAKVSNNGLCLGWRESYQKPYQWLNYNEALLRAKNLGSGLISYGLQPGTATIIGIYSINCPEWILTEQACYCYGMVLVPLYDTLGADACAFIIKQTEISVIMVEDDAKCNMLLEKSPRCLKRLIVFREVRPATKQRAKNLGIDVVLLTDVERLGAKSNHPEAPPQPQDLCTICYTSGTTGNPKGVMLTHENVVASVSAVLLQLGDHRLKSNDVMISFLPLAHMLERCCEVISSIRICYGVGYSCLSVHEIASKACTRYEITLSPTTLLLCPCSMEVWTAAPEFRLRHIRNNILEDLILDPTRRIGIHSLCRVVGRNGSSPTW